MIDDAALAGLIRARIPDAQVQIRDRTGTMNHFNLTISSGEFHGKSLLEQHKLVYGALEDALKDGRVHAVELKTIVLSEKP